MLIFLGAAGISRAATTFTVYGNSLAAGWQDESWSTTNNFSNKSPVYTGNKDSLAVTITAAWGGLQLIAGTAISSSPYNSLQFYIDGGAQGGQKLTAYLLDSSHKFLGNGYAVQAGAGQWTKVTIPLTALTSPATVPASIGGVVLMDATGGAQPTFYLNDIAFIKQPPPPPPPITLPALIVYGNVLASGWQDWSWGSTRNFYNTSPLYPGNVDSLAVTITGGYGALYLASVTPPANVSSPWDTLQFNINGGTKGGQKLNVFLTDNQQKSLGDGYAVQASAGKWTKVKIPLTSLTSPSWIGGVVFMDSTGGAQATFYLDDIAFVNRGLAPPPTLKGPALSINVSAGTQHPISPNIYGMNYADEFLASALNLPVRRWGGNSTTRYNWQTNMHNVGSDWYFENIPNESAISPSDSDQFIEQDRRHRDKDNHDRAPHRLDPQERQSTGSTL